jgi:hypothetical protein
MNTFTLEDASLACIVPRPCADPALRIHDAVPRNGRARRQRMKCVTHEACLPRQPGEARYLSIGRNAAPRYL